LFTVNNAKQVIFSPGNLQATTNDLGTSWTWRFADNQYDNIGAAIANNKISGNKTVSENGTVDSFGYSTGTNYYGISNSTNAADYAGDFIDWGTISTFSYRGVTTTYPSDYWRSLTANSDNDVNCDWRLLRDTRTTRATVNGTSNARYTEAVVNYGSAKPVNGIILFPDDFDGVTPMGVTWGAINSPSAWGTQCTASGWTSLELAGCVFLPVNGGRRSGNSWWDTSSGWYRPHILGGNIGVYFASNNFIRNDSMSRYYGMAVRLVHQIN
jgi:hypothetical protein